MLEATENVYEYSDVPVSYHLKHILLFKVDIYLVYSYSYIFSSSAWADVGRVSTLIETHRANYIHLCREKGLAAHALNVDAVAHTQRDLDSCWTAKDVVVRVL